MEDCSLCAITYLPEGADQHEIPFMQHFENRRVILAYGCAFGLSLKAFFQGELKLQNSVR